MQPEKHIFWYLISFQVEEEKEKKKIKSLIQTGGLPQFFLLCKNLTCSFGFVANEPYRSITAAATL